MAFAISRNASCKFLRRHNFKYCRQDHLNVLSKENLWSQKYQLTSHCDKVLKISSNFVHPLRGINNTIP
jgi:hypothetical protein